MTSRIIATMCIFALFASQSFAQKTVPNVDLKTLKGETVNFKEHIDANVEAGKITVISFWATWCSPCKKELDAIADYYEEWQEDFNVELIAITIDTRRALAKVGPMVATKGWDYLILSDANNNVKNALGFQTVPQTYLIDQNGHIIYEHSGYAPGDEVELEDKIKKLVASN